MEIVAHSHMTLIDTPLSDLDLPDGLLIGAILRGSKVIIPDGNSRIQRGDVVIILGLLSEISNVEKLLMYKR